MAGGGVFDCISAGSGDDIAAVVVGSGGEGVAHGSLHGHAQYEQSIAAVAAAAAVACGGEEKFSGDRDGRDEDGAVGNGGRRDGGEDVKEEGDLCSSQGPPQQRNLQRRRSFHPPPVRPQRRRNSCCVLSSSECSTSSSSRNVSKNRGMAVERSLSLPCRSGGEFDFQSNCRSRDSVLPPATRGSMYFPVYQGTSSNSGSDSTARGGAIRTRHERKCAVGRGWIAPPVAAGGVGGGLDRLGDEDDFLLPPSVHRQLLDSENSGGGGFIRMKGEEDEDAYDFNLKGKQHQPDGNSGGSGSSGLVDVMRCSGLTRQVSQSLEMRRQQQQQQQQCQFRRGSVAESLEANRHLSAASGVGIGGILNLEFVWSELALYPFQTSTAT